jgi:hypothetical protein
MKTFADLLNPFLDKKIEPGGKIKSLNEDFMIRHTEEK